MSTLRDLILGKIRDHRGFLAFVFILFSVRWSFADQYRVPTGSMEPTIQIGDHIFVDKMAYDLRLPFTDWVLHTFAEPERGDVITFDYPLDPSQTYVKRLIGLPGDHIEIVDGFIEVNGSLTVASRGELAALWAELQRARPGILHHAESLGGKAFEAQRLPARSIPHALSFTVPEGRYFFMGDNRDNSADGRSWGFVERSALRGRVRGVIFSIAMEGWLPALDVGRFGAELT